MNLEENENHLLDDENLENSEEMENQEDENFDDSGSFSGEIDNFDDAGEYSAEDLDDNQDQEVDYSAEPFSAEPSEPKQETSSNFRVMRFEDFVSSKDN
jgi:hypothetical protein